MRIEMLMRSALERKIQVSDIIALDVSKRHSYCVYYKGGNCVTEFDFQHNKPGFERLYATVKCADNPTVYFEATGIYSRPIERFCRDLKIQYVMLNPLELHLKTESLRRTKTDKKDAHRIAMSACDNSYRLTCFQKPIYIRLRELCRFYERLEKSVKSNKVKLNMELQQTFPEIEDVFSTKLSNLSLNIMGRFSHPDMLSGFSRTQLKNIVIKCTGKYFSKKAALKYANKLLDAAKISRPAASADDPQIEEVKFLIDELLLEISKRDEIKKQIIDLCKDLPEFDIITSFPGIGDLSAALLIGELGEITRFDNANQLNAYIGIDLMRYQSGKTLMTDHINRRGNAYARAIMYMIVDNMISTQASAPNHIVDYYYKLKKRPVLKLDMVARVACMNKTLKCLFSMIKNRTKYNYKYMDSRSKEMH